MKLTKFEKRLLILCSLVIILFSYLLYDDSLFFMERKTSQRQVAELIELRQDVRFKFSESFSWTPAHQDEKLYAFDSIFTGENSTAVLKLDDGSVLRIDGQSLIVLSMYQGQLVLDLKSGSLSGDLSQTSNLLLKTKEGLKNLKGQDGKKFRLEKDFAGQSLQSVDRKPANLANDQIIWKSPKHFRVNRQDPKTYQNLAWIKTGTIRETIIEVSTTPEFTYIDKVVKTKQLQSSLPLELPEGSYFVRLKGYSAEQKQTAVSTVQEFEIFDKKRTTLQPPVLLTQNINHSDSFNYPPLIKWTQVDQALKYKVELSSTPRFDRVVQYDTENVSLPWTQFQPGTYFVRVYSLNKEEVSMPSDIGTIEVSSQAPFLLPIPKILVRTEDPAALGPQKITLNWKHLGKQDGYRVEVSRDGTFRDAKLIETKRGLASLDVQKPGQYHVRVFATNKSGEAISPSSNVEVINYQVKNLLTAPKLWKPFTETTVFLQQDDNPYLWLDWKPVLDAEKFQVEIAQDKDFQRIIASESTPKNRYLVGNKIPYGQYYWRVKAINETEKADSDWSQVYRFYLFHKKKEIFFE